MSNSSSTEPNPFKNIERTIIVVLVIWILAIGGWFISNQQIPTEQKLISSAEDFLKEQTITAEQISCIPNPDNETGICTVISSTQEKLSLQCPVKSTLSRFAAVFFAKEESCTLIE